jgi:two-component system chemotaxis response regulator CheB
VTNAVEGIDAAGHDVIVIGGSRGSLEPLQALLRAMPSGLAASLLVVQHRAAGSSSLESLLARSSALPVRAAVDGEVAARGTVYVAPPDRHLFLAGDKVRVLFGPRENLTRPSIDVLFRSAAIACGSRVVGVVLSGALNDGAAGLAAIRRCGGVSVVQDPDDALDGELPANALAAGAEHRIRSADLGSFVLALTKAPRRPSVAVPLDLELEGRAAMAAMSEPGKIVEVGQHTQLVCPECQGPVRVLSGGGLERYRCHVGHSYTPETMLGEQGLQLERALWVAYRTLLERARMLEGLERDAVSRGRPHLAQCYEKRLNEIRDHVDALRSTLSSVQAPPPDLEIETGDLDDVRQG